MLHNAFPGNVCNRIKSSQKSPPPQKEIPRAPLAQEKSTQGGGNSWFLLSYLKPGFLLKPLTQLRLCACPPPVILLCSTHHACPRQQLLAVGWDGGKQGRGCSEPQHRDHHQLHTVSASKRGREEEQRRKKSGSLLSLVTLEGRAVQQLERRTSPCSLGSALSPDPKANPAQNERMYLCSGEHSV